MRMPRVHTRADRDIFEGTGFRDVSGCVLPGHWDDAAAALFCEKIACREIPAARAIPEDGVPQWLWRRAAVGGHGGQETDIRAVLHRIAGGLAYNAWKKGLFDAEEDAHAFYDELRYVLFHRIAAPEINLLATAGLNWAYGIDAAFRPEHAIPPQAATLRDVKLRALAGETSAVMAAENPDSLAFIGWKHAVETERAAKRIGLQLLHTVLHRVMDACDRDAEEGFDPEQNYTLDRAVKDARRAGVDEATINAAISYAKQGYEEIPLPAADDDMTDITPILTVPDEMVESALTGHSFPLQDKARILAGKLWDALAENIWASSSPHVFFREGAPGPAQTGGYVGAYGTSAPFAAINLAACPPGALAHTAMLLTLALSAATEGPVMVGLTNISSCLVRQGLAYDSDAARATVALAAAITFGGAAQASAGMAQALGTDLAVEKAALLSLKEKMRALVPGAVPVLRRALRIDPALSPVLATMARDTLAAVYGEGVKAGFRHAHLTGISPAPEMQILLNARTDGLAPARVIAAEDTPCGRTLPADVQDGLKALHYTARQIDDIGFRVLGHGTLVGAPGINHDTLRTYGFDDETLAKIETALKDARDIRPAFTHWVLGRAFCEGLSYNDADLAESDMLAALGFSAGEISAANLYCCGTRAFSSAPQLKPEHVAVFDSAPAPEAQVKMQAAVEPFLSGAAAHTIALPAHATVDDVQKLLLKAWELGVRTVSLARDDGAPKMQAVAAQAETRRDVA